MNEEERHDGEAAQHDQLLVAEGGLGCLIAFLTIVAIGTLHAVLDNDTLLLMTVGLGWLIAGWIGFGQRMKALLVWLLAGMAMAGLAVSGHVMATWGILLVLCVSLWARALFESHDVVRAYGMAGYCAGLLAFLTLVGARVHPGPREAPRKVQCRNSLRQLGVALRRYHEQYGAFPPAVTTDAQGRAMHNWAILLLPFIEETPLYRDFDFNRPWDDPANAEVVSAYVSQYECPSGDWGEFEYRVTHYRMVVQPGSVGGVNRAASLDQIRDGPGQTILLVECVEPVPWASPQAVVDLDRRFLPYDGRDSNHGGGVWALFADGTVRWLDVDMDHRTLVGLGTMAGGEPTDQDDY